jgi:multimeric flavodoxin WrbA/nitrite reductase/ring-hydroxylating ferredoxin subunit
MTDSTWIDLGDAAELAARPLQKLRAGGRSIALSCRDGVFGAVANACNHAGGPLGRGSLEGDYIVCPWHQWKFHRATGLGEPGFEADRVPAFQLKVEGGRLLLDLASATPRQKAPHPPHPLTRPIERAPGPLRVVGVSATAMDERAPRYSGSEDLLRSALEHCGAAGAETRLLRLSAMKVKACRGYYSKSAHACTWPCSITQMDPKDEMEQVYEAFVHWADVVLLATPIRWGTASSLYFRMAERLNCVQNQVTIANRVLIRDKVAGFIVVGGQDNVQGTVGQLLGFFAELGFAFPQFPFVAHSRGWSAEDMERNETAVREGHALHEGAAALAARCLALAGRLVAAAAPPKRVARGGRKAQREPQLPPAEQPPVA